MDVINSVLLYVGVWILLAYIFFLRDFDLSKSNAVSITELQRLITFNKNPKQFRIFFIQLEIFLVGSKHIIGTYYLPGKK